MQDSPYKSTVQKNLFRISYSMKLQNYSFFAIKSYCFQYIDAFLKELTL
ncbi:hypothetical protein HMPREF9441_03148 [Paraprevotella clara YIT 11840]|uniref:Uncharacterized protein n=1 Tax=Paraprevotella clara YIT 11840 TaxID=762968 RepID=G5SUT6_9BACT|nr:hypothetical protein HMPREF9441_03148 [Paraprevotella clara YIT 11840]